jgi:hypothetical protein
MRRVLTAFLLFAMLAASMLLSFLAPAAAQDTGTITVHARMCDQIPPDDDWFGDCHDDLAGGVLFEAINMTTGDVIPGSTARDGNVTFTLAAGTWQIAGPPGDFLLATVIYCSEGADASQAAVDHPVTLAAGEAITCDYYFVPDPSSGPGTGTIEVHARICDAVPADDDWFGACHDDLAADVYFDAIGLTTGTSYNGTTGANGNLVFTLPVGTWQLSGPPGDFLEATVIYCSTGHDASQQQVAHPVVLDAGDAVTCDYFFVPENLSGLTPTPIPPTAVPPTPAPTSVPPTPAPTAIPRAAAVEIPAVLVMGTCADVTAATEVATLSDLVILEGETEGSVEAMQAATSYSVVDVSLETMMGSDYVLAVLDADDDTTVVACGAVGGTRDGQAAVAVGLAPVEASGVAGVAYLAPSGGGTAISMFVVEEGLLPLGTTAP